MKKSLLSAEFGDLPASHTHTHTHTHTHRCTLGVCVRLLACDEFKVIWLFRVNKHSCKLNTNHYVDKVTFFWS